MADNELHHVHTLLLQLQDVLREKFELEEEIEVLPAALKEKEGWLEEANAKYVELNDAYNKARQDATSNSIKYDDAVRARTDAEKLVEKITLQREYEAVTKQIDEARVVENALLKARNASNKLVEELDAQLKEQGEVCDGLKAEVDEEKSKIDGILKEKNEKIGELDAKCIEIKGDGISDDIYAKFCRIVKNKNGLGITPIIQGQVCSGCHMILPMQFVNDVRLGTSATEYCPYCSRILYYQEDEEQIDLSDFESGEGGEDFFADAISDDDFDNV